MTVCWHNPTIRCSCAATGMRVGVRHARLRILFLQNILPDDHDAENACFSGPVDLLARMAPRGEKIPFLCQFRLRISEHDTTLAVGEFRQCRRLSVGNG
ncbi:hypothetical protein CFBP5877_21135 [Agrobacterium tumefaciens]|uniref:Uncharacterized protein n=1 Tax=Agrobacterium tumefaciens TaxID=358 RepID=A0AAE6BET0_AGRTU|nr:hypothetical protein CFBP5499_21880 [Agrobacterium tumefaciens]QCL81608.1 hypothetical protein CFBP5877_21135 [Agrobacterium tumefaciens]